MNCAFILLLLFSNLTLDSVESTYLVSVSDRCVGAIVEEQFVLTTASCVVSVNRSDAYIANISKLLTGTFDRNFKEDPKRQEIEVESICIPKNYQPPTYVPYFDSDIAIIKLKDKLKFTENGLESLTLPSEFSYDSHAGEFAVVSGFRGDIFRWFHGYSILNGKHYASIVEILSYKRCADRYANTIDWYNVCSSMMTGANSIKPHGACNYGSPLVGRKNELIGLAISVRCDETKYPTIYTNVAYYLSTIQHAMKNQLMMRDIVCRHISGQIVDANHMNWMNDTDNEDYVTDVTGDYVTTTEDF